jgi:hypothetical protein
MADDHYYRVLLDEEWTLDDLYAFPRAFGQTYAFVYCLDSDLTPRDRADHYGIGRLPVARRLQLRQYLHCFGEPSPLEA